MRARYPARATHTLRALSLAMMVSGCSSPPPAGDPRPSTGLASTTTADPSPPAPAPPVSADELLQRCLRGGGTDADSIPPKVPVIAVEGTRLTLDGAPAGVVLSAAGSLRLQKVDELFSLLKAGREAWNTARAGVPFPGAVGLRATPDTPMVAFMSAFQTAAYSGYPNICVQSATDPADVAEVKPQIPAPPPDPLVPPPDPPPTLHVRVESEVHMTWKKGSAVLSEERVPLGAPNLADTLCAAWKARGSGGDPAGPRRDPLVLFVDNQHPVSVLHPLLRAAGACKREVREGDGTTKTVPVFEITLSAR